MWSTFMATSHYLKQCWVWHSHKSNFPGNNHDINLLHECEIYTFKNTTTSIRSEGVKAIFDIKQKSNEKQMVCRKSASWGINELAYNNITSLLIHIEAKTKWPLFSRRHIFKWIFLNENECISMKISLKFVPRDPMNNIPALVQIVAWRRPGDKPLSEPMMVSLLIHICITWPQPDNVH